MVFRRRTLDIFSFSWSYKFFLAVLFSTHFTVIGPLLLAMFRQCGSTRSVWWYSEQVFFWKVRYSSIERWHTECWGGEVMRRQRDAWVDINWTNFDFLVILKFAFFRQFHYFFNSWGVLDGGMFKLDDLLLSFFLFSSSSQMFKNSSWQTQHNGLFFLSKSPSFRLIVLS